ncbi:MFS transporter [Amycolatopsis sp. NPDC004368]
MAPNYSMIFIARIVTAVGAGLFMPCASAVAAVLTTPDRRGSAVATVYGGLTFALILGVPLGTLSSQWWSYEVAFLLAGVLALASALAVGLVLPRVAPAPAVRLAERFVVARDRGVVFLLVAAMMLSLGGFMVYTFASSLLAVLAHASGGTVAGLLFCYGVGGALGNSLGGRTGDRWGSRGPLLVVFGGMTVVLALLPLTSTTVAGAGVTLFAWAPSCGRSTRRCSTG